MSDQPASLSAEQIERRCTEARAHMHARDVLPNFGPHVQRDLVYFALADDVPGLVETIDALLAERRQREQEVARYRDAIEYILEAQAMLESDESYLRSALAAAGGAGEQSNG